MEVYKTPSKEIQEIILANLTYETATEGLNGYFASEPRNSCITVKMESDGIKQYFALYEAEGWADILIEWLRKKHDIFYRPGMTLDQVEAARNAAKMCCLRAHIKDEICKRGIWCDKDADIPELVDTLFKAYDEEGERADKNRKDVVDLAKENRELRKEVKYITRPRNDEREDAQKEAKQECYKYLWDRLRVLSPDCDALKITDYEKLVDRIFYEMSFVSDNCKRCRREHTNEKFSYIQRVNKAEGEVKTLKEQLDKNAEKADINKLIRDYCVKYNVVAPSRYLSDEACVEYVFSKYNEANHEIENLRGQITRLKDLINAMNEEVGDM